MAPVKVGPVTRYLRNQDNAQWRPTTFGLMLSVVAQAWRVEQENNTVQTQTQTQTQASAAHTAHGAGNEIPYEELLRVLGHLIDTGDWHEVVVVETNGGILLKGIKIERGQAGNPFEIYTERWYSRAELLDISVERSGRRSSGIKKLTRFLAR
jgi:hypothetical protein